MPGNRLHRRDLLKALAALGSLAALGCDRPSKEPCMSARYVENSLSQAFGDVDAEN